MSPNESTSRMKERLHHLKEKAAFQRLKKLRRPRMGRVGWFVLLLFIGVPVLLVKEAEVDRVELDPLLVQLYSERGMEPPQDEKPRADAQASLPEDWQKRFQPREKTYPLDALDIEAAAQYKQIERYEILPRVLQSAPRTKLTVREDEPGPDTLHIHDKDLVLAGRGFEIGRFEPQQGLGVQLNSLPLPEAESVPLSDLPDYGKRSETVTREKAVNRMIFHAGATGIPPRMRLDEPMEPESEPPEPPPVNAEPVPGTRLVLDGHHEPLLLLTPGREKPVDLLMGNPAVNRHLLEQRERHGK